MLRHAQGASLCFLPKLNDSLARTNYNSRKTKIIVQRIRRRKTITRKKKESKKSKKAKTPKDEMRNEKEVGTYLQKMRCQLRDACIGNKC